MQAVEADDTNELKIYQQILSDPISEVPPFCTMSHKSVHNSPVVLGSSF